jgi:hypothetical protein
MKCSWRITVLSTVLGLSSLCPAQSTSTSMPSHQTAKRSKGFLDYVLGKINPGNKDYGSSAADERENLVGYTIQSLYFWSNLVSLSLLAGTSTALVLVLRTQDKREIIAATLISQLWNGRVTDRAEIVRRTGMYNALVETKNASLTMASTSTKDDRAESPLSEQPSQKQPTKKARVPSQSGPATGAPSLTHSERASSAPSADLDQKTKLLEGQNQALRNSERNLRERLNQVSQDLEQERRRNQTLKGA